MSLKMLLGLEDFSITDREIIEKINEAHRKQLLEVEFSSSHRKVTIRLSQVNPIGLTRGHFDYWTAR